MTPEEREMLLETPAVQELLREERRACAAAMCPHCAAGAPLEPCKILPETDPSNAVEPGFRHVLPHKPICRAWRIHARSN